MNPPHRNLLFRQIPHDRFGHVLRILHAHRTVGARIPFYFDDITLLALQLAHHLIQRVLRLVVQHGLTGAEADVGVC